MFEQRNIKRLFLKTRKQTKDFLLSAKSREFFVFLCFFFIAAGFWLLQTLNNDYETEFSIPVRLRNVPENVVITSDPVSEVRVRVRDKGTVLLNYMLGKNFYPVILDFKNYINMGNHVQVQTSQVQKWITGQLNASTALLSMKPDTLEYYYSTGVSKMIPVKLCGNVSAGEQYYLPDTLFTPDSVRVYAPSDALDTMKVAYTLPLNLDNITDTLEREVTLSAPKGAKYIPASVKLTLPVDMYTEKTVEVPIKISFQVGMGRFRQITADDFHLVVSYEELVRLGSEKYTVKLRTLPEGVSHVRFNPEQVDFLIEQIPADYGY